MIRQMVNFKYDEGCFLTKYSSSYAHPKIWWQIIDDSNNYLKSLAIKLLLITPHSVTCERIFSILGFLYDKRRQSLNLSTIKMMAKIWYYLFSNIKKELNHSIEETENDLKILLDFFDEDEKDEVDNFFDNNNEELLEILLYEV